VHPYGSDFNKMVVASSVMNVEAVFAIHVQAPVKDIGDTFLACWSMLQAWFQERVKDEDEGMLSCLI
tara:strand:- start:8 stop:208 length:201 start_codon:yes stop_codon:yes gene_type:complete